MISISQQHCFRGAQQHRRDPRDPDSGPMHAILSVFACLLCASRTHGAFVPPVRAPQLGTPLTSPPCSAHLSVHGHERALPCRSSRNPSLPQPLMLWRGSTEPVPKLRSALLTIGWFSWWSQAILSTVSGVLLLFANSVSARPTSLTIVGRALTLAGLGAAIASTLWTVAYGRLARKLGRSTPPSAADAAERAGSIAAVGTTLNIVGMVLCLLGAETIVGTLAAKALTQSTASVTPGGFVPSPVQALDVLIVQANTNTLFAHFISLCANMRLHKSAGACEKAVTASD